MDIRALELTPEQLCRKTDPAALDISRADDPSPLQEVIGQERAVRAIDFGVDMPSQGYNIFAVGPAGSGRTTAVRQFLDQRAAQRPVPEEWCYVYNFADARRPRAINLPTGRGAALHQQMEGLLEQLQREIPRTFESEHYEQRRREITLEMQRRQQELYQTLEAYLNEQGFALIRSQMGLNIAPMLNGEILSGEAYQKLTPELRQDFESHRPALQEQFDRTMRETRELDREVKAQIENINTELAGFVVDSVMVEIRESFSDCPKVSQYLQNVHDDVIQHVGRFVAPEPQTGKQNPFAQQNSKTWFDRYRVNRLVENQDCDCAPVVIEDNPTYHNLVGRIEHRAEFGAMVTEFTQIRAGALHRANGGYLIVEAKSLLANGVAWEALKRGLRNREIKIEELAQYYGLLATATLEPEPIPLDVKVVIIGDERLYQIMNAYDEDFGELFKVKAQFVTRIKRDDATHAKYVRFVADLCHREGLRSLDARAMARLLDESSRLADDQNKITTRFADVADLIRETSFWAGKSQRETATADDVRRAVQERIYRQNLAAERYVESVQEGVILIDTDEDIVGQVNGLSVVQTGNYAFGLPSRITARTFLGRAGVVSIDREVKISGPIHDKGQLILSSYLSSRFAQNRPLGVSISLTFEQLYSGVEGDSASSTELYALLSALSGIPIHQSLAVTGSVNQLGQVQAIGGVNHKIEGFFDICQARGLSGDQGVLIPQSNVRHLMLRDDVIEAVENGQFHIYAVSTIEQGIEILTGTPAGEMDDQGEYEEGTVYAAVQAKLKWYADKAKSSSKKDQGDKDVSEEDDQEHHVEEPGSDQEPES